jgi:predicted ArsR family transcriptional regulator
MNTTREQLLRAIRARSQATIAELAEALRISVVSIRHHLSTLQAEGLVESAEVRRGAQAGRPHLVYSLTEAALERFPTKYVRLSERLLDELKASLPPAVIENIFAQMAQGVVAEYSHKLAGKSLEEKLELLVGILGEEGFLAEWNRSGEIISLTEYNCPYVRIGQRHPEICAIDETVIRHVLDAAVEKTTCVLNGAERCVFVITPNKTESLNV